MAIQPSQTIFIQHSHDQAVSNQVEQNHPKTPHPSQRKPQVRTEAYQVEREAWSPLVEKYGVFQLTTANPKTCIRSTKCVLSSFLTKITNIIIFEQCIRV